MKGDGSEENVQHDENDENVRLQAYNDKLSDIWAEFMDDENSSKCQLEPINEKMELRYKLFDSTQS